MALLFAVPASLLFMVLAVYPMLGVFSQGMGFASLVNPTVHGFAGLENFRTVGREYLPGIASLGCSHRLRREFVSFAARPG